MTTLVQPIFEPKRKADVIESLTETVAQRDKTIKALMKRIDALEKEVDVAQKQLVARINWRTLK